MPQHVYTRMLQSPWFFSLVPSLVVLLLLPKITNHYSFREESFAWGAGQIVFEDLNADGVTEKLSFTQNTGVYKSRVTVADNQNNYYDQWNLIDSATSVSKISFGDFDRDKKKEIYIFTQSHDSIFLYVNEFFDKEGLKLDRHFITTFGVKGKQDIDLFPFGWHDQNGDGNDELYFSITIGYGLWPRLVYFLDLNNRQLVQSPFTSINLKNPEMRDIDGDGHPEIFGSTNGSGNYHTPTPFSDYTTWMIAFDDSLNLIFPPIAIGEFGSNQITKSLVTSSFKGFVTAAYPNPATSKQSSGIMKVSLTGEVLLKKNLEAFGSPEPLTPIETFSKADEEYILMANSQELLLIDDHLEIVKNVNLPQRNPSSNMSPSLIHKISFSSTIPYVFLVVRVDGKTIELYTNQLEWVGSIQLQASSGIVPSVMRSPDGEKLLLKSTKESRFVTIKRNRWHWFGYLFYPIVYLGFVGFVSLIQNLSKSQIEKREREKRRLQELQLRSIKGQLDPHFTFNALNAIGSMMQLEDRNVAYDYLAKFTRLLRQLIADSDRVYRTLAEELEFVESYLKLEKIRFDEKFSFSISVSPEVKGTEMVPIMSVQIFAENAIRHGIMPLEHGGKVEITVAHKNNYLHIFILDNGVGREKAQHDRSGTGKGLRMTREFYDILNQNKSKKIAFSISDADGGGTIVNLSVPI